MMRFERKFHIDNLAYDQVELLVKLHPAMFFEEHPPRFVNNIYLDSLDLDQYQDAIHGSPYRQKYRIRWYGDLHQYINHPTLEIKKKQGLVGNKIAFSLRPFQLKDEFTARDLSSVLNCTDVPSHLRILLQSLEPVLINRYRRKYYISANRKFRLTIDSKIEFYPIDPRGFHFRQRETDDHAIVVELKYDADSNANPSRITNFFPFRMTKNSKYVNGIEKTAA